jgi:hypothetical protein
MENDEIFRSLKSQYDASLAMLEEVIDRCPEHIWFATDSRNRFWHIVYHALFYTHLYLHRSEEEFRPLALHQPAARLLDGSPREATDELMVLNPYSKEQMLDYLALCRADIDTRIPNEVLSAASGFDWLSMNRFELHLYNIRHLQHHCGQLTDRLRNAADIGIAWERVG